MNDKPLWKRVLNKTRQRLAGLVGRGAAVPEKPSPDASTGFQKLPREIMEKVVKNLATSDPDDPRATARNLNNFRQASRSMRDFVDKTPSVGRFSATLNEAGRLAKDLHERTYPKKGLPEVDPDLQGRHEERGLPVPAGERLAAVGPLLKFQSARVKSKVARDVRAISNPDARADGIAATAQNIGALAPKDQSSLIGKAIKNLGAKGRLDTFRRHMAAEATVGARDHLQPKHQSELAKIVRRRPELNELINNRINRLELRNSERSNGNISEVLGGRPKEAMERLRDNFDVASTTTRLTEHQRVEKVDTIAMATAKVVDEARAELMESKRRRRGSRGE